MLSLITPTWPIAITSGVVLVIFVIMLRIISKAKELDFFKKESKQLGAEINELDTHLQKDSERESNHEKTVLKIVDNHINDDDISQLLSNYPDTNQATKSTRSSESGS